MSSRVEVNTLLKLALPIVGEGEEAGALAKAVREWVKDFIQLGGKNVFVTYGAGDFPNAPCLIVPAPEKESARRALAEKLIGLFERAGKTAKWKTIHDCICVGTRDALAMVATRKPVERPELIDAIEADNSGVAQIAFALSADAKKIHEQVAPTLPAELGGGRIQIITRGLKWAALTIGPGPKMPTKLIVEATSPQAAQDLHDIELKSESLLLAQLFRQPHETHEAFEKRVGTLLQGKTSNQERRALDDRMGAGHHVARSGQTAVWSPGRAHA